MKRLMIRKARTYTYNGEPYLFTAYMLVDNGCAENGVIKNPAGCRMHRMSADGNRIYSGSMDLTTRYEEMRELSRREMVKSIVRRIRELRLSRTTIKNHDTGEVYKYDLVRVQGCKVLLTTAMRNSDKKVLDKIWRELEDELIEAGVRAFKMKGHDPENHLSVEVVRKAMLPNPDWKTLLREKHIIS